TWEQLSERFAGVRDVHVLRHPENRGVAAAILTGIQNAPTEIVCSIDCDCSYDPNVLESMVPMIGSADLVTASPYHPQGRVFNVPGWRLFLSKTLSIVYSLLLRHRIYTFTSCCRVYRKSFVERLRLKSAGFLGVAEMLIQTKLLGGRVAEHPATLESRLFGESKMKVARTIFRHLGLIAELCLGRIAPARPAGGGPPRQDPQAPVSMAAQAQAPGAEEKTP
ncbi:MAG: glycosyltransferase, partial [Planctomycetes bacterium]|nr:glycosyltransferase [Planctomycetota bacterium]